MPLSSFYEDLKKTLKYEIKGAKIKKGSVEINVKIREIRRDPKEGKILDLTPGGLQVEIDRLKWKKTLVSRNCCHFYINFSFESMLPITLNVLTMGKLSTLKTEVISISPLKRNSKVIRLESEISSSTPVHFATDLSVPYVNKTRHIGFSSRVLKDLLKKIPEIVDGTMLTRYIPLTKHPLPIYTLSRAKIKRAFLSVLRRYKSSSKNLRFVGVYDGIPMDYIEKFKLIEPNSLRIYLKVKPFFPTKFTKIVVLKDEQQGSIYLESYEE